MKRHHLRLLGTKGPKHDFGCRRHRAAAQLSAVHELNHNLVHTDAKKILLLSILARDALCLI